MELPSELSATPKKFATSCPCLVSSRAKYVAFVLTPNVSVNVLFSRKTTKTCLIGGGAAPAGGAAASGAWAHRSAARTRRRLTDLDLARQQGKMVHLT